MTYTIVFAKTPSELQKLVNDQIRLGWKLQGGLSYCAGFWAQAMVSTIAPE